MYGAQARYRPKYIVSSFENDVEMYGAQAKSTLLAIIVAFENDVEMYGAQARMRSCTASDRLRMM